MALGPQNRLVGANKDGTTVVAQNAHPRCPGHLPQEAKKIWKRVVPHLADAGILAEVDVIQLGNLCWAQAYLERCSKLAWEQGPMVRSQETREDGQGRPRAKLVPNPIIRQIKDWQVQVNRLASEFGLTVRARAALGDTVRNGNAAPEQETPSTVPNPRLRSVS